MRKALLALSVASVFMLAGCTGGGGDDTSSTSPVVGNETVSVALAPGSTVTKTITVDLPDPESGDLGVDVMWLVDLSGSFYDDLSTWQNNTKEIVNALKTNISDLRIGLASFVDAPCSDFGSYEDYGYKLEVPLTSNFTEFETRVDNLTIFSGNDWPESQLEAMYQAITGEGRVCNGTCENATINATTPGWGDSRLHLLIVSTDANFHRPTDVGWDGTPYPYPSNVTDVIDAANRTGVSISFLFSGWYSNATEIIDYEPAIGEITNATHGVVYALSSDSSGIVEKLKELTNSTIGDATIELVPEGSTGGISVSISPSTITGIDLLTTDTVSFTVTFEAPEGTSLPSSIDFNLVVKVEGSEIYRIPIHVVTSS